MPKIVDHNEMRRGLLTRSFSHFAKGGYRGVSIRHLAKELGVTTGTLYHYFKNKEELFCLMIEAYVQQDVKNAALIMQSSNTPFGKIKLLTKFVIDNEKYFKHMLFLLIEFFREEDIYENEKKLFRDSLELYRKTIQDALGFPFKYTGAAVIALFIGLFIQKIVDPKKVSIEKVVEEFECTII